MFHVLRSQQRDVLLRLGALQRSTFLLWLRPPSDTGTGALPTLSSPCRLLPSEHWQHVDAESDACLQQRWSQRPGSPPRAAQPGLVRRRQVGQVSNQCVQLEVKLAVLVASS